MPEPFLVDADRFGRINHFTPAEHPEVTIRPEFMVEYLDGGERLTLDGAEYDITEAGNLIHPDVEVIPTVKLGFGVRLGPDVVFRLTRDGRPDPDEEIVVGSRSRVEDTEVEDGVHIGAHNLILARFLGASTHIGSESKLRLGVQTEARTVIDGFMRRVTIKDAVKIAEYSIIGAGATIGFASRLGADTVVSAGETVGPHSRIGMPKGTKYNPGNRGGMLVRNGNASAEHSVLE